MADGIKYGAHIYLWTDSWSEDTLYLIERTAGLGLSSIEIAVGDEVKFNARSINKLAREFQTDIILSPGGVWPMHADISHDAVENRKAGLAWHKKWINNCESCGAIAYTGAIYSHPGRIEKRKPSPDEFSHAAENLNELAEYSRKHGTLLVIEPMSHFRTHLVNTPEQAYKLVIAAGHNNLKVLLDTYHLVTEIRDYASGIQTIAPFLWGLHACENDRGVPGKGLVPWKTIGETLHKIDFSGYCILESYNSSINQGSFSCSRGIFQNICPDGDVFVRDGLKFLMETFG